LILLLPRRLLPKTLIAIGAASIAARSVCFHLYPDNPYAPYVGTVFRLDGLCMGGLIAIAYRNTAVWAAILARRTILLGILCALLAMIPFYTWFLRSSISQPVLYDFGHTYLTLLYGAILTSVLIWSGSSATAWLRSRTLTGVGLISYSLYLFHPSFKGLFFVLAHRGETLQTPLDAVLLAAALISTFGFCAALYRYVELPAQKLGKRFKYEKRIGPDRNAIGPAATIQV
jgi:peptidoglycan/LPS O-acetylase OafA/YrhL